jgi:long-chain acyl-CoA synthetase
LARAGAAANGYGLTETNGGICNIAGDQYLKRDGSCGEPMPLMRVCVVDEDSADGAQKRVLRGSGQRGELLIRGALNMREYWNKPEQTKHALVDLGGEYGSGWFCTGDVAELDADGFIYIVDRKKDLIIRGGENISCSEVESALYTHPAVLECAVFGLKDPRLGERVGACVVLKPGSSATVTELLGHVASAKLLAQFKLPLAADVFLQREQLLRGETGKILKREIREHFNALLEHKAPSSRL